MIEINFQKYSLITGVQNTLISRYVSSKNIRYYIYRKTNDEEFIGQFAGRDIDERTAFFFAIPKFVEEQDEIPTIKFANTFEYLALFKEIDWSKINFNKYMEVYGLYHFKIFLDEIDKPSSVTRGKRVNSSNITNKKFKPIVYAQEIVSPETNTERSIREQNIRMRILKFLYHGSSISRKAQLTLQYNHEEFLESVFCDENELYLAGEDLLDEKLMTANWWITFDGKKVVRGRELESIKTGDGKSVFVAQSFSDEILPMYEKLFEQAIKSCGYEPILMSLKEPESGIDKEILSLIDSCVFMIADLTLERPSVYYEAGYAMGKNRKVFFTAHSDHNTDHKDWKSGNPKVHFDVRNYKITWWELDSLEESFDELTKRIKAWENKR